MATRAELKESIGALSDRGRRRLKQRGIRFGQTYLWMPAALEDNQLKTALWNAESANELVDGPEDARIVPWEHFAALLRFLGFVRLGEYGVRVDTIEAYRLAPKTAQNSSVRTTRILYAISKRGGRIAASVRALEPERTVGGRVLLFE